MAKLLYVGTCGTEDPTKATFPFLMAKGAIDAGHETGIILMGEAAPLIKDGIVEQVHGIGIAPLKELMAFVVEMTSQLRFEDSVAVPVGSRNRTWQARTRRSARRSMEPTYLPNTTRSSRSSAWFQTYVAVAPNLPLARRVRRYRALRPHATRDARPPLYATQDCHGSVRLALRAHRTRSSSDVATRGSTTRPLAARFRVWHAGAEAADRG